MEGYPKHEGHTVHFIYNIMNTVLHQDIHLLLSSLLF